MPDDSLSAVVVDAMEDLYRLDLAEFTPARDALAKRLRAAGNRAGAERVRKLRRPPLTAWGLNQAAHQHPDLVDAAFDAGAGLRAATRQAIGGDASALRPAQRSERQAVERVVSAAAATLQAAGHQANDAARIKMAETMRAAMIDVQVAAGLRRGVLDRDHQVTGFGLEGGDAQPADDGAADHGAAQRPGDDGTARPGPGGAEPGPAERPASGYDEMARQRAKKRAAELSNRAREQADAAGRLRSAADQAQRQATQARDAADQAQRRAAEADQQAAEAEQKASEAEQAASTATADSDT